MNRRPWTVLAVKLGCGLLLAGLGVLTALADQPAAPADDAPIPLSLGEAVRFGLERNPELMALRQQHGIAEAGIVIANTYPFNPALETKLRTAVGPASAGITNVLSQEHKVLIDIECRGQGGFRRAVAGAALTRTDYEIANQELLLTIRVIHAFDGVIYRFQKRRVLQESIDLNQEAAKHVGELVNAGTLRSADRLFINTELVDSRAQLSGGQVTLTAAYAELRRALGVVDERFQLNGELTIPVQIDDVATLTHTALERRADLQARRAAESEAEGRLGLEMANRYGNINAGPAYEYDPTRINLIGAQVLVPFPVFNSHKGEILQRQAERAQAAMVVRQLEIGVEQDVRAALSRLEQARALASAYQKEVRPALEKSLLDIRELFEKREPGVDLLRVIDIQRKVLKARDSELDALYEVRQALADLAAAVGDPSIAVMAGSAPRQ